MKVFWLFNHPAPYKVNFFNTIGKHCDLLAVFERKSEAGRNASFYKEKATDFEAKICRSLPLGGVNNWTREPVSILKKNHFDIVVLNGWYTFTEQNTISYCKDHKIPYIFYINGGIVPEKEPKWKFYLKKRNISGAAAYFCPDETSKQYLIHYGAEENKIHLYPYSSVFQASIAEYIVPVEKRMKKRTKLGYPHEHLFISSGQFIKRKNFEALIQLWKDLPESYGLLITGEGPLKKEYENLIQELGLANRVHLSPYIPHEELLHLFRFCDGFVFTSKEDIYGHVINEAMSQGLPVISSKYVNSAKKLIKNGINGYLVDIDQPKEIEKAILSISEEMREKAIDTAKENTIELSAENHLKVFQKYLEAIQ